MKNDMVFPQSNEMYGGLTKREYFIGQALIGVCAACTPEYLSQVFMQEKGGIQPGKTAITIADKLCEILEQEAKS